MYSMTSSFLCCYWLQHTCSIPGVFAAFRIELELVGCLIVFTLHFFVCNGISHICIYFPSQNIQTSSTMHFSPKAVEKIATPVDTAWTIPPASALASSVSSKLKNNKVSHMDDQRGRYDISVFIMNSCFLSSPCPEEKN